MQSTLDYCINFNPINAMPDLTDVNEGYLKYKADFKYVYATILNKWPNAHADVILGDYYNMLDFI